MTLTISVQSRSSIVACGEVKVRRPTTAHAKVSRAFEKKVNAESALREKDSEKRQATDQLDQVVRVSQTCAKFPNKGRLSDHDYQSDHAEELQVGKGWEKEASEKRKALAIPKLMFHAHGFSSGVVEI